MRTSHFEKRKNNQTINTEFCVCFGLTYLEDQAMHDVEMQQVYCSLLKDVNIWQNVNTAKVNSPHIRWHQCNASVC